MFDASRQKLHVHWWELIACSDRLFLFVNGLKGEMNFFLHRIACAVFVAKDYPERTAFELVRQARESI